MGLRGRQDFDRRRLLDAAARARSRRRRRRAIALYRWVLAMEPRNLDLHARLGPLLAETGQSFDAWTHFRAAAKSCERTGHPDRALAVYREAALYLPREYQVWQAIAHLHHKHERPSEAVDALLEGSRQLRARWCRPQAIYLLRRAREIEPWRFEVVLEMARLLATCEQRDEARVLLSGLADRSDTGLMPRVRGAQLAIDPGPLTLWRWLRATLDRPKPEPAAPRTSSVVPLHARGRRARSR